MTDKCENDWIKYRFLYDMRENISMRREENRTDKE